jgi:hypothetical protein
MLRARVHVKRVPHPCGGGVARVHAERFEADEHPTHAGGGDFDLEYGDGGAEDACTKALDRAADDEDREVRRDHLDSSWMEQFQPPVDCHTGSHLQAIR